MWVPCKQSVASLLGRWGWSQDDQHHPLGWDREWGGPATCLGTPWCQGLKTLEVISPATITETQKL